MLQRAVMAYLMTDCCHMQLFESDAFKTGMVQLAISSILMYMRLLIPLNLSGYGVLHWDMDVLVSYHTRVLLQRKNIRGNALPYLLIDPFVCGDSVCPSQDTCRTRVESALCVTMPSIEPRTGNYQLA